MKAALKEAQKAYAIGEIPVGAVVVYEGKIIARGHNLREKKQKRSYELVHQSRRGRSRNGTISSWYGVYGWLVRRL